MRATKDEWLIHADETERWQLPMSILLLMVNILQYTIQIAPRSYFITIKDFTALYCFNLFTIDTSL